MCNNGLKWTGRAHQGGLLWHGEGKKIKDELSSAMVIALFRSPNPFRMTQSLASLHALCSCKPHALLLDLSVSLSSQQVCRDSGQPTTEK